VPPPTELKNRPNKQLAAYCFLGLFFNPEDGGSMLYQNIGKLYQMIHVTFQKIAFLLLVSVSVIRLRGSSAF
jgi:hypothetical protein